MIPLSYSRSGPIGGRCQAGMSLIELMVAMLIALLGTIVMTQVFSVSEGVKRTATGASDAQQSGSFSIYNLERQLRLGGEGLNHVTGVWGCTLNSWRSGTATVPPNGSPTNGVNAYPTYFTQLPANLRITPALVVNGGTNATDADPDSLVVMAGQHRSVALGLASTAAPGTSSKIPLTNSVGISQNDLLLAVDQDPGSGVAQCRIAQAVDAAAAPASPDTVGVVPNPVGLSGGTYTGPNAFNSYSATVQVADLGPAPIFTAFALGADGLTSNALLSYGLLDGPTVAPVSIGDNIVNMQVVYGVVASPTVPISAANPLTWQTPTGTGATGWSAATLMDGSTTSRDKISSIRAVRVAIVARSAQYERENVTGANWKIFSDLPAAAQMDALPAAITGTATWQQYRYRTYDVTIPLRNMLIMNNS